MDDWLLWARLQSLASYFIGSGWQSSLTTLMSNFCRAQPRNRPGILSYFHNEGYFNFLWLFCFQSVPFCGCLKLFILQSTYPRCWLAGVKSLNKLQSDCQALEQTFPMFTSYSNKCRVIRWAPAAILDKPWRLFVSGFLCLLVRRISPLIRPRLASPWPSWSSRYTRDYYTGLWLAQRDHVTWMLASDWPAWSRDLWLAERDNYWGNWGWDESLAALLAIRIQLAICVWLAGQRFPSLWTNEHLLSDSACLSSSTCCRIKGCNEQTLIMSQRWRKLVSCPSQGLSPAAVVPCPTKQIHTKLFLEMLVAKNVAGCSF